MQLIRRNTNLYLDAIGSTVNENACFFKLKNQPFFCSFCGSAIITFYWNLS